MRFEYDPAKSAANKLKHGVDFREAQSLWDDPDLIELEALSQKERRFLVIGRIGLKHWAAVYTVRTGVIRLISVRRARAKEIHRYER